MRARSGGGWPGLGLWVGLALWAAPAAAEPGPGAASVSPGASEAQVRATVLLVVLSDPRPGARAFAPAHVDAIEAELRRVYQVEVRRLATRPLPRSAYYPRRRRYRADTLLEYLGEQIPAGMRADTRVLGLTTADISTTKDQFKDWGVFGLGQLGGTAAMVSSHRLTRKAKSPAQALWRVTNTAVHELGHVLGLDHCEEQGCVMLDAQGGIANTDASTGVPGPQCRAKLDVRSPLRPADAVGSAR